MKNKNNTAKATTATPATPEALKPAVLEALTEIFDEGLFNIPDDCVVGTVSAKLATLEAQVKSLTARLAEMQAKLDGKPGALERVDVLATPAPKGKKK